jgi:hypothetical protein
VGTSDGASSHPPFIKESSQQSTEVVVPAPGAPVEPDTTADKVAPVWPASPTESIVVFSEDEAEAAPCAATPTVFNLRHDIPDTPDAAPSSEAERAEEASSLVPPRRIVDGILLGDEMIIEPPIIGANGDLVRFRPETSMWGGSSLAWTSIEGDLYFVLDDVEEREF